MLFIPLWNRAFLCGLPPDAGGIILFGSIDYRWINESHHIGFLPLKQFLTLIAYPTDVL